MNQKRRADLRRVGTLGPGSRFLTALTRRPGLVLGSETEVGVLVELDDDGSAQATPVTKSVHYRTLVEPTVVVVETLATTDRRLAEMARRAARR